MSWVKSDWTNTNSWFNFRTLVSHLAPSSEVTETINGNYYCKIIVPYLITTSPECIVRAGTQKTISSVKYPVSNFEAHSPEWISTVGVTDAWAWPNAAFFRAQGHTTEVGCHWYVTMHVHNVHVYWQHKINLIWPMQDQTAYTVFPRLKAALE